MNGDELLDVITQATGLPQDPVERELRQLLQDAGCSIDSLTLEQLREVMSNYLQDVLLQAQASLESFDSHD